MSGDDDISEEDRELFRDAMAEVVPLEHDRRAPDGPRPAAHPAQREADEAAARAALESGAFDDPDADPSEELTHLQPGLQKRVWRRLRRGQYAIEAELDLHGMTRAEAATALERFMRECREQRAGCVRIVHGKGRRSSQHGPVLKPAVAGWLRRRAEVLAFCSARPVDGGSGALYVLLAAN